MRLVVCALDENALLQLDVNALSVVREHDLRNVVLDFDLNRTAGRQAGAVLHVECDVDEEQFFVIQIGRESERIAVEAVLGRRAMVEIVKQREGDLAVRIGAEIVRQDSFENEVAAGETLKRQAVARDNERDLLAIGRKAFLCCQRCGEL